MLYIHSNTYSACTTDIITNTDDNDNSYMKHFRTKTPEIMIKVYVKNIIKVLVAILSLY